MIHFAAGSSRIVQDRKRIKQRIESGGDSQTLKGFQALSPGEGDVDFGGCFNPETGG